MQLGPTSRGTVLQSGSTGERAAATENDLVFHKRILFSESIRTLRRGENAFRIVFCATCFEPK